MTSYENLSYQPYDFNSGQDFIRLTPDIRAPTERNRVITYEISDTAILDCSTSITLGQLIKRHPECIRNIGIGHSKAGHDVYRINKDFDKCKTFEQCKTIWDIN